MAAPTPFTISVPQTKLDALQQKLALSAFPDELEAAGWDYGAPLKDVKRLAEAWKSFDWRKAEEKLNELPQYMTKLGADGYQPVDLHFVHARSSNARAIPLLFVHGWPGSFLEVVKLLPLLTSPSSTTHPTFHVVAPSLPNFGFSGVVKGRGFRLRHYAQICHRLMLSLGYDKYVTQGGDWGAFITRTIDLHFPQHCLASHINMVRAEAPKFSRNPLLALQHAVTPYTETEKRGLQRSKWFGQEGSGYRILQSTKPQTLGYSLTDSPVGLLAWIYEKLHDWTDNYPWTDEEILTWVSIYAYSTAGPAASLRIYYEVFHSQDPSREGISTQHIPHVKLGLMYMPKELGVVPKVWGRTIGDVVYESEWEKGGHFAAWEMPEAVAGDLHMMFGKGGPCEELIKGKDGFGQEARAKL